MAGKLPDRTHAALNNAPPSKVGSAFGRVPYMSTSRLTDHQSSSTFNAKRRVWLVLSEQDALGGFNQQHKQLQVHLQFARNNSPFGPHLLVGLVLLLDGFQYPNFDTKKHRMHFMYGWNMDQPLRHRMVTKQQDLPTALTRDQTTVALRDSNRLVQIRLVAAARPMDFNLKTDVKVTHPEAITSLAVVRRMCSNASCDIYLEWFSSFPFDIATIGETLAAYPSYQGHIQGDELRSFEEIDQAEREAFRKALNVLDANTYYQTMGYLLHFNHADLMARLAVITRARHQQGINSDVEQLVTLHILRKEELRSLSNATLKQTSRPAQGPNYPSKGECNRVPLTKSPSIDLIDLSSTTEAPSLPPPHLRPPRAATLAPLAPSATSAAPAPASVKKCADAETTASNTSLFAPALKKGPWA